MLKSPVADPGLSISKSLLFAPGFGSIKVGYSVARPLLSELFLLADDDGDYHVFLAISGIDSVNQINLILATRRSRKGTVL